MHYVFVTFEGFGDGEVDFGLDFVGVNVSIDEKVEEGEERENKEEEEDVVAKKKVVRFVGGVFEPKGFGGC